MCISQKLIINYLYKHVLKFFFKMAIKKKKRGLTSTGVLTCGAPIFADISCKGHSSGHSLLPEVIHKFLPT